MERNTIWKLTSTTRDSLDLIYTMCREARESIYIELFLLTADEVSREFIDILINKAKAGLTVKCIFDSIGSRTP